MSRSVSSRLARAAYLSLAEVPMELAGWELPAILDVPKPDEEVIVVIGALLYTYIQRDCIYRTHSTLRPLRL